EVSWFDDQTRKDLRDRASEFSRESARLDENREQLSRLFASAAFEPRASEVIAGANRFQSFFQRLLPAWKRWRREFLALYKAPSPKSSRALRADSSKLRAHRERWQAFVSAVVPVAQMIRWEENKPYDWHRLLRDLGRIEQLQSLIPTTESLARLLTVDGAID